MNQAWRSQHEFGDDGEGRDEEAGAGGGLLPLQDGHRDGASADPDVAASQWSEGEADVDSQGYGPVQSVGQRAGPSGSPSPTGLELGLSALSPISSTSHSPHSHSGPHGGKFGGKGAGKQPRRFGSGTHGPYV